MTDPPSVANRSGSGPRRPRCGGDLKAQFACPDCGTRGWVYWERLPRGMRCPACGGCFWVDGRGHVQSLSTVAKIRFRCPRCGHVELFPEELAAREVRCRNCRQRFHRQSDGRLLSDKEMAELRAAGRGRSASSCSAPEATRGSARWARRLRRAVVGCLCLGVIAVGVAAGQRWLAVSNAFSEHSNATPEQQATALAELWLAGRSQEAARLVRPHQQQALQTWLTLVGHRPGDDGPTDGDEQRAAQVSLLHVQRRRDSAVVRLRIKLAAKVEFVQTQVWTRLDGRWCFDAERTLHAVAGPEGLP